MGYRFGSHGGDGSLSQDVEIKSVERSRDLGKDSGEQGGGWRGEAMEKSGKRWLGKDKEPIAVTALG